MMTPRIVVIGGGLTGAVAAIHLLGTIADPFDLVVLEPDEHLGRGLAYGRAAPFHLLNVRAGRLGVLHDQPNDFAAWARGREFGIRQRLEAPDVSRAFLSRRLFGDYVRSRLSAEIAERPDVRFTHRRAVAAGVRRLASGYKVFLDGQPPLAAQIVILATGYGRSTAAGRFGRSPFTELDHDQVRAAKSALFVGSGLTFVDEFLRLRSLGFRGHVLAVSRHGLLPEVHRPNEAPRDLGVIDADRRLHLLFTAFRRLMQEDELPAAAAVDLSLGLRQGIQPLWQALGPDQQRRFLRHVRSYWNVVRHRLPPEAHAQVRHARQSGALKVETGRVTDISDDTIRIQGGSGEISEHRFDLVFDCTGHRPEITSPLILSLIKQGLACADPHDLGVTVEPDGGVLNRLGNRSLGLFALGPLGHGSLYEITAVPEIVAQCADMARGIEAQLRTGALGESWAEFAWARTG